MAEKIQMVKLTKHFGINIAGETASFTTATAEHIRKHSGGDFLGEPFDPTTHEFDRSTGKVVAKGARKPAEKSAA